MVKVKPITGRKNKKSNSQTLPQPLIHVSLPSQLEPAAASVAIATYWFRVTALSRVSTATSAAKLLLEPI